MSTPEVRIAVEDPATDDVVALLSEHLADMHATSPAESVHALDVRALRAPHVTFLAARDHAGALLGVGALAVLGPDHGEIESMRTTPAARGRGVAAAVLARIVDLGRERGLARLSLETGTQDFFAPAHRLYERHGFVACGPFGSYRSDPHSRFYTLALADA
ncbi:GNAT family N-acetyltransferase [Demequina sp. SYSU T00039]|uniref:GNAT family N-acetyltransferase n=1 Tax=Demequina lignilytica TaxID=3051663 RepID=A0AAW7M5P1_9MICO|nr:MULTISPECIES: GNAT family N-acetyltransferase [unclassified Demequina]MDN4477163.1 GNAT family N-acetyltransferase [Demequina sp. SYSU T00039-1]MDN4487336.1 GNAT family N-acetyltransferase [Demequina sp. SYSU T00039]MDN4491089.1 GNAT family N-acetyltransferase [Demequina sp. SYSU T00068]